MAEINTKKQQLTYHKGITNSPSDYVCSDNELADEVGMIFNGAEHQPIQSPVKKYELGEGYRLIFIHTLKNGTEHFIIQDDNGGKLIFKDKTKEEEFYQYTHDIFQINAIGNTLVVNTNEGLRYFLWDVKNQSYKNIGNKLPEPNVDFRLSCWGNFKPNSQNYYNTDYFYASEIGDVSGMLDSYQVKKEEQDTFNALIVGAYSANKKHLKSQGGFCNPFLIRYALKLYDGSVANISNPIIMFPSLTSNSWITRPKSNKIDIKTFYSRLVYKLQEQLDKDWEDIVKGIDVYISDEIDIIDTNLDFGYTATKGYIDNITAGYTNANGQREGLHVYFSGNIDRVENSASTPAEGINQDYFKGDSDLLRIDSGTVDDLSYATAIGNSRTAKEIISNLEEIGNFYYLFSIDYSNIHHEKYNLYTPSSSSQLENIANATRLPNEDFYGHNPLKADSIKIYNNRLTLVGAERLPFDGFKRFTTWDGAYKTSSNNEAFVTIDLPEGECIVKANINNREDCMFFFYYPDTRAKKLKLYSNSKWTEFVLKPHPTLNGAYWINDKLPSDYYSHTGSSSSAVAVNHINEKLNNQILTSEVNNPFVFKAEGNNTLDVQKIIGIATMSTALSQGQFGQYPMIVFTNDGIWAMQTNAEGLYTSIVPMSREVCNNPLSITQTDGAVFFSSEKGLMVVVGSEVKCVSEQLNGKYNEGTTSLQDILKNSGLIAYDYRDSLLWILDDASGTIYIYNIKAGTFARFLWQGELIYNVVNHYPDTLLQDEVGNVYSLLEKPNINSDESTYTATIETRPMKLENAFAFKSLRQLKNVFDSDGGSCTLAIQASNDMKNWTDVESLKGKGWKYFKFKYKFADMKATDRFAGTFLVTQERYTEKLR